MKTHGGGALPLRPLTTAELLDSAVALLRTRAVALIGLGLVLAAAEQAFLYPLRQAAFVGFAYLPDDDHVGQWWVVVALGFGLEAAIIALLGGLASRAAVPALLGPGATSGRTLPGRPVLVVTLAIVVGLLTGGAALAFLPWFVVYGVLGLVVPAALIDQRSVFGALGRSVGLVFRSGLRPGLIRLVGYLGWLIFRLALGIGGVAAIGFIPGLESVAEHPLLPSIAWAVVNTVAYPTLACLDAVLHLEARMRVEGLDLTLRRVVHHGGDALVALTPPKKTVPA